MISRKTIGSLLVGLLLGVGVAIWAQGRRDACDAALSLDARTREMERVQIGSGTVLVPCRIWILRQPAGVQGACLAGLAAGVVFVLSASGDVRRSFERR